jgi:hypothetical protein
MDNNSQSGNRSRSLLLGTLLLANAVTIGLFIAGHASVLQVLWTYWWQSITIGLIQVIRLLTLGKYTTASAAGSTLAATPVLGRLMGVYASLFFVVHYGIFHLVYAIFLSGFGSSSTFSVNSTVYQAVFSPTIHVSAVILGTAIFALHHGLSFLAERADIRRDPSAYSFTQVFSQPYKRIVPMHLIIILGPVLAIVIGETWVVVVFMLIKTVVDVGLFTRGSSHPRLIVSPAGQ